MDPLRASPLGSIPWPVRHHPASPRDRGARPRHRSDLHRRRDGVRILKAKQFEPIEIGRSFAARKEKQCDPSATLTTIEPIDVRTNAPSTLSADNYMRLM